MALALRPERGVWLASAETTASAASGGGERVGVGWRAMAEWSSERVVRGACPHDCPDTCAMRVTVDETGRAAHVAGDDAHPVTAGFLCGKVSNYLDRVYAED